jgi:hypothetical protein
MDEATLRAWLRNVETTTDVTGQVNFDAARKFQINIINEVLSRRFPTKKAEDLTTYNGDYESFSRGQLLSELQKVKSKWFEKNERERISDRRYRIKQIIHLLNTKYPKPTAATSVDVAKKPEQLRPNHMPTETPAVYVVEATYPNGTSGNVQGFAYANGLYVPRHGVSGASSVSVVYGNKKIALSEKCVVLRNGTDHVMYALPAGMRQNKGMKFRSPVKGEIVTLFWQRANKPGALTQMSGLVGDEHWLGSDKSLRTFQFDGSTEEGCCGGVYIAAKDGYCVGIHGIGASNVTVMPEFYPMSTTWAEELVLAQKRIPTYVTVEDTLYYKKMKNVINNGATYESLNY